MPLRLSCLGPVLRLACLGRGRPGPVSPYLAWGCALPVGWARPWELVTNPTVRSCELALRAVGPPLAWLWGARGRALSYPRPLVLLGVRPGPTTYWLSVRGVRALGPVTNPTARALACWLCALWERHEGAWGGARLAWVWGARGSGTLPPPTTRPFGRVARAHYPLAVGAGGVGVGTRHQRNRARSCVLALRAVGAARGRLGGAPLAWVWGTRGWALSHP